MPDESRLHIRIVIIGLVSSLFIVILFMGTLALLQIAIPDQLDNIGIGLLAAVAGILAKTSPDSGTHSNPMQTHVVNTDRDPVPTTNEEP